jgi:hypothetical protein
MAEKAAWLLTGRFDCLVDANIDLGRSRKIPIMFGIIVVMGTHQYLNGGAQ